ncbi:MAG TPA: hypothetical protein VIK04_06450 [Solirubrobacteraceae bacterium]
MDKKYEASSDFERGFKAEVVGVAENLGHVGVIFKAKPRGDVADAFVAEAQVADL